MVRFYNTRGTAEHSIKEAGGRDDAALLSPLSRQRGAAMAEPYRLQLGEFVAAAGAAVAGCQLVAHQLQQRVGEDPRTAHPTCALSLVAIGRQPSETAAVRGHAGEDRDADVTGGIK
jgi:hypothetical protein